MKTKILAALAAICLLPAVAHAQSYPATMFSFSANWTISQSDSDSVCLISIPPGPSTFSLRPSAGGYVVNLGFPFADGYFAQAYPSQYGWQYDFAQQFDGVEISLLGTGTYAGAAWVRTAYANSQNPSKSVGDPSQLAQPIRISHLQFFRTPDGNLYAWFLINYRGCIGAVVVRIYGDLPFPVRNSIPKELKVPDQAVNHPTQSPASALEEHIRKDPSRG